MLSTHRCALRHRRKRNLYTELLIEIDVSLVDDPLSTSRPSEKPVSPGSLFCGQPLKYIFVVQYSQIDIKSYTQRRLEAQMERHIWTLDLTEDDKQKLREDARHVPTPRLPRQPAVSFSTPLDWNIWYVSAYTAPFVLTPYLKSHTSARRLVVHADSRYTRGDPDMVVLFQLGLSSTLHQINPSHG